MPRNCSSGRSQTAGGQLRTGHLRSKRFRANSGPFGRRLKADALDVNFARSGRFRAIREFLSARRGYRSALGEGRCGVAKGALVKKEACSFVFGG